MGKTKQTDETTALANVQTNLGALTAADFAGVIEDGFESIETVMFGDSAKDKQPMYLGELLGPGRPVEVGEPDPKTGEISVMPTWQFRPCAGRDDDGNLIFSDKVTHVAPCNYMVDAGCRAYWDLDGGKPTGRIIGILFLGRGETRTGRQLNRFRVFSKARPVQTVTAEPTK